MEQAAYSAPNRSAIPCDADQVIHGASAVLRAAFEPRPVANVLAKGRELIHKREAGYIAPLLEN